MKSSVSGFTTAAVALAASIGLTTAGPHRAYAAPETPSIAAPDGELSISVLSPTPRASFSGNKPVEIAAFYQGTTENPIVSVELLVDGQSAFTKTLDSPEQKGVISFLVDASQLTAGAHRVVVRAVASDAEIVSAKSSFTYISDQNAVSPAQPVTQSPADSDSAPSLTFLSPGVDQKVTGTIHIQMQATDASGQQPYVSLFVDKQFKTLRNYAPYDYDLDTTGLTNGYHTIEVYAYNDEQNVGPAKVLRIYVNNPGGNTSIRTDLKDAPVLNAVQGLTPNPALTDAIPGKSPVHRAVATRPIDRINAPSLLPPRKHPSRMATAQIGAPSTVKAVGPARRPSPRVALTQKQNPLDQLRAVMMAKRPDLLDQTGGLDLSGQLSDSFIPDTATAHPAITPAQTPTTGFRPMPSNGMRPSTTASATNATPGKVKPHLTGSQSAPSLATPLIGGAAVAAQSIAVTHHVAPAHVQTHAATPVTHHTATVQVAAPVAHPKHVVVATPLVQPKVEKVAAPVVEPKHVQAAAPIVHPKHVEAAAPAVSTQHLNVVREVPVRRASALVTVRPAVHFMPVLRRTPQVAVATTRRHMRLYAGRFSDLMREQGRMTVVFNHTILLMDRPTADRRGMTFSALRQVFEYQGGTLNWDQKTSTVHAVSDTRDITLHIGSRHAVINHEAVLLSGAPYLASGRTMVPLSFVANALDANVRVDPATGNLLITSRR